MELTRDIEVQEVRPKMPSRNQIGQYMHIRKELTQRLHDEVLKDPTLNAVCSLFALRERSRKQVTLRNLSIVMYEEGFKFTRLDFERCLLFLASLGVGTLDRDIKGNIRSLKNIKFSLQNLGLAALGRTQDAKTLPFKDTRKPNGFPKPSVPTELPKPVEPVKTNEVVDIKIVILDQTLIVHTTVEKATKFIIMLLSGGI